MNEQLELVKQIAARLHKSKIPYMLTGSMAQAVYSTPRMTRDIDIIIEISLTDVDQFVELFANDCYIDKDSVKQAILKDGMFNIIHNDSLIKADFIIRKNDIYRKNEFSRKQTIDIEGTTINVVAPEDLILSKLLWGKNSQSEFQFRDVTQLIQSIPELNWDYLKKWALTLGIDKLLNKTKINE